MPPQQGFATGGGLGRQAEPPGTRPWSVPGAPWGSSLPSSLPSLPDQERKLCAHPRLEIYQQDQIYFMCPLARQGDFYVPEMKETERKSRGPAEASDARVDDAGAGGGGRGGTCGGRGSGGGAGPAHPEPSLRVCGTHSLAGPLPGQAALWASSVRPRTHRQSSLFPDTWVPVGVASHALPLATQTRRFCWIPGRGSRGTLGDTDHRQLGARGGWGLRLPKKGVTWVGSSGSKIGTGSGR